MSTIRELIKTHSDRLRQADTLTPHEAANILVECVSLLASLNAETALKQYEYHKVVVSLMETSKSATEAKLRAQATQEWMDWKEREMQGEALEELIRVLKVFIKRGEEEFRHS